MANNYLVLILCMDLIDNSKCFMWNTTFVDPDELVRFSKTNKLLCLYDNKVNSLDKFLITSNKLDQSILKNITMFVSNKSSFAKPPIIILNNLSSKSLDIIRSDPVLKLPYKYNISLIFIGTDKDFENIYREKIE